MNFLQLSTVAALTLMVFSHNVYAQDCPPDWLYSVHSGTCIKYQQDEKSWYKAREACKDLGGDLVKILNAEMNTFITDNLPTTFEFYLIGLRRQKSGGPYRWLDENKPVKYLPPVHHLYGRAVEACVLLGKIHSGSYWYDYGCSNRLSTQYICEQKSECDAGYYGDGCKETCSEHCVGEENPCHRVTGTCDLGCDPGYQGDLCSIECETGYHGDGCKETCSEHCVGEENSCHHVNGHCNLGCDPGYQGDLCLQESPQDRRVEGRPRNSLGMNNETMIAVSGFALVVAVVVCVVSLLIYRRHTASRQNFNKDGRAREYIVRYTAVEDHNEEN